MPSKHPLESLASQIGHVTIAWNDLHFWVYVIFWRMMKSDAARSQPVFFSIGSDRGQRTATAALANVVLFWNEELLERLTTALNKITNIAFRRNDLIHAMWTIDHPEQHASVWSPSNQRLSKKDLQSELATFLEELNELRDRMIKLLPEVERAMAALDEPEKPTPLSEFLQQPRQQTAKSEEDTPPSTPKDD